MGEEKQVSEKQIATQHIMDSEWKSHNVNDLTLEKFDQRMSRVQIRMINHYYPNMGIVRKRRADKHLKILKNKLEKIYE